MKEARAPTIRRGEEKGSLPPHVLRLVRKSFREPLDTLEREVLLGWDQARKEEFIEPIKKGKAKKEGGTSWRT